MTFFTYFRFLPESPVWLTSKQDYKAACEVVEQMMKLNNKKIISNDLLLLQLKVILLHNEFIKFFKYIKLTDLFAEN